MTEELIEGDWGYAIVKGDELWIPAIQGDMGKILRMLHEKTGKKTMVFSAVLNPESFKKHLKNVVAEWDAWFEEVEDWSHCIKIDYAASKDGKEEKIKHDL